MKQQQGRSAFRATCHDESLAFARRQALKPEVFDVGARLRAIADMLDTVTGAPIRITTEMPETSCFIQADPSQFETALLWKPP